MKRERQAESSVRAMVLVAVALMLAGCAGEPSAAAPASSAGGAVQPSASQGAAAAPQGVVTPAASAARPAGSAKPGTSASSTASQVLVGAGDIGECPASGPSSATAKLIASIPGTVFAAGDEAYPVGSTSDFRRCYDPTWGPFRDRTRAVPGNHEYLTRGASAYFTYFGAGSAPPGGYYAFDLGQSWRIYMLNSQCDAVSCAAGSAQERWLSADLAANPRPCVAAIWHRPRWSSGAHGNASNVDPLWRDLAAAHAALVLNGHDHDYERFAPLDANGRPDPAGIREFVVGTGGAGLRGFGSVASGSQVRDSGTWGVLELTLKPRSYDWRFLPAAGGKFSDAGSGTCP